MRTSGSKSGKAAGIRIDKRYVDRPMILGKAVLLQVRDCCCDAPMDIDTRSTDSILFLYALSGDAKVTETDRTAMLRERHYVFIGPERRGRATALQPQEGTCRLFSLEFRPEKAIGDCPLQVLEDRRGIDEQLFRWMEELEAKDRFVKTILECFLKQIEVLLYRNTEASAPQAPPPGPIPVHKGELAYQTMLYIDKHVQNISELSHVSADLGYSYSHVSHVFRAETGFSLQSYWTKRRVMKAMNWLQSGRKSITQIAEALHYQSIHSFSKAFKKITGLTPTEYQTLYGRSSSTRKSGAFDSEQRGSASV